MSARELELLSRFVEKANPPTILHRYRRASEWTIKELTVPEVHITGVEDMNDPFEYRTPLRIDIEKLRDSFYRFCCEQHGMDHDQAKQEATSLDSNSTALLHGGIEGLRSNSGLVCCSSDPRSNRMWGYYGEGHKGICIGYGTNFPPFSLAQKVFYRDPTDSIDLLATLEQNPSDLADQFSCRKGLEWEFEQEFRIPVGPFPKDHTRLLPIDPRAIAEIRLGVNISDKFRADVLKTIKRLPRQPQIYKMGCDNNTFRLIENAVS